MNSFPQKLKLVIVNVNCPLCNCSFEFQRRMTSVERSLEEAENLNIKFEKMHFLKESVHVNKNR